MRVGIIVNLYIVYLYGRKSEEKNGGDGDCGMWMSCVKYECGELGEEVRMAWVRDWGKRGVKRREDGCFFDFKA